ncbi:hypothetical protein BSG8_37920 [Bacillus subtilis subsp. natto]|nr:hypothetical protein BsBEST3136_38350 [Bacillus subtilis]BDB95040.1 hypothetical protein BSG8_37920 [Bacillus subtilis subsp. natto]BEH07888.1 hypothetical protein BSNN_39210 [Bacillus subtilis subsp. natto]GAK81039.1 hypothetical protein BSMD_029540 [Bacillus subtilis Miyagi-4]
MELSFPLIVNYFIDTLLPGRDWGLIIATSIGLFAVYALSSSVYRDLLGTHAWYQY